MIDQLSFIGVSDLGFSNDVDPMKFHNQALVVFSSFGNDSVALIRWLYEYDYKNVTVLFSNTGWASPEWPQRVLDGFQMCEAFGFKYEEITSIGMKEMVRKKKGFPPNGPMQFCTAILKIEPAMLWMQAHDPDKKLVCVTGVRREESQNRKDHPQLLNHSPAHEGRPCWSPLFRHDKAMRNELIERTCMPLLSHKSDECWPCVPNANRQDILRLTEERIADLEALEKSMGFTKNSKPRTVFRPARYGGAVGIRDVVRWAKREPFKPDPAYDGTDILKGERSCTNTGWCGI